MRRFCILFDAFSIFCAIDICYYDRNGEEIVGTLYKKELQKANQNDFRVGKVKNKNAINYVLNGKAAILLLIIRLMKKT